MEISNNNEENKATSSNHNVWLPYDEKTLNNKLTDRDAQGKNGAVASSSWYASNIGLNVLKNGGNAVDAAVAIAYTLGVVEPFTSGIGGGGFMIIYNAKSKQVDVVDYRGMAPLHSNAQMWLDESQKMKKFINPVNGEIFNGHYSNCSQVGGQASSVPGEVAGLEYSLTHFGSGKFSRKQLMQDAIDLAENGYIITKTFRRCTESEFYEIQHMPEVAKYYLNEKGLPLEIGTILTNKDLAKTYRLIAENGPNSFYKGEIAQAIVNTIRKYGGCLTLEDLAGYQVKQRKPITSSYRDYQIFCLPPPSGGTQLLQILNIIENFDMKNLIMNSKEYIHYFSETFKMTFADRAKYMADTEFAKVPLAGLTSKEYAKKLAKKIDSNKSVEYKEDNPFLFEHHSTTSFSVIDKEGNMVASTQTINHFFGCKVAIDGYGFIMNDDMDDFSKGVNDINRVEPKKRPLSSMTPTLVLNSDGSPFLTIGSPGGPRIFPTLAQIIHRMIDYNMDLQDAINTARIFDNISNNICYESGGITPITPDIVLGLEAMGHKTTDKGSWNLFFGGVQGIEIKKNLTLHSCADPRRDGKGLAY